MKKPSCLPRAPKGPQNLKQVREALAASYAALCQDPGAHDQARIVAVVMGRMISTVTAAVSFHHLTKTAPGKSLDKFVRG